MPRTKETRNFLGTILQKKITRNGRKVTVFTARKRYALLDADGNPQKDAKGKIIYKDKTKRCFSMSEAQIALTNITKEIEQEQKKFLEEQKAAPKDRSFFELVEYFRTEYVKPAIFSGGEKIAGYRQDLETIKRHLNEFKKYFGDVPLKAFTYEDFRRFKEHLASTPTKFGSLPQPSTYNRKLTLLNRVLNVGVQLEWLVVNPMKKGKPLIKKSIENKRNRMLTFEEEERLLAQCVGLREHLKLYILLSLETAMRRSEVWNLQWWQVDFQKSVIYLTEEAAKKTKTGEEGILPLTKRLADELKKIHEVSPSTAPNDLVVGKLETKRSFHTACRLAGIKNLQYRDLRATGATRMVLAGNPESQVMKATRHTEFDTFLTHYTGVDVKNAQVIGERLQQYNEIEKAKIKFRESLIELHYILLFLIGAKKTKTRATGSVNA